MKRREKSERLIMRAEPQDWLVTLKQVVRYRRTSSDYSVEYKQIKVRQVSALMMESYLSGSKVGTIEDERGIIYPTRDIISAQPYQENSACGKNANDQTNKSDYQGTVYLERNSKGQIVTRPYKLH